MTHDEKILPCGLHKEGRGVIIAVISDMHGNGVALNAALKDVKRQEIDRIVCLGDAIQGGSQPAQVIERLQDLKCPVIMGNGDNYVLTGESAEVPAPGAGEVREWTREQIGPDGLDFVASFQSTLEIDLQGGCWEEQMLPFSPGAIPISNGRAK